MSGVSAHYHPEETEMSQGRKRERVCGGDGLVTTSATSSRRSVLPYPGLIRLLQVVFRPSTFLASHLLCRDVGYSAFRRRSGIVPRMPRTCLFLHDQSEIVETTSEDERLTGEKFASDHLRLVPFLKGGLTWANVGFGSANGGGGTEESGCANVGAPFAGAEGEAAEALGGPDAGGAPGAPKGGGDTDDAPRGGTAPGATAPGGENPGGGMPRGGIPWINGGGKGGLTPGGNGGAPGGSMPGGGEPANGGGIGKPGGMLTEKN